MTTTKNLYNASPSTTPSVLFVTRAYPPQRGGMERFSYDLTTSIAARTRAHIIANRFGRRALPLFLPLALARASRQRAAYDILHLGDPVLGSIGWILKTSRNHPTAMTIHGLDILYPSRLYQWYLSRFLGTVDLFICISTYVERALKERFPAARTVSIPPGIRDTMFRPETTRAELSALVHRDLTDARVVLTVGRLIRRKGAAWFVGNVLPRLPEDIIYIVVGQGRERAAILEAARAHRIERRLLLLNDLDDEHVRILYNAVDLFVMPNITVENDIEGFGLVALEAATCRVPVVAAALQGISDAVYDGRNGLLIEAENATRFTETIVRLLENVEERRRLGAQAREFTLARFSWNTIAQRYLDTFAQLCRL